MKNLKLTIFAILGLQSFQLSNAQIHINNSDLPSSGDNQISFIVDSLHALTLNPGNAGENIEWDFSYLTSKASDTISWINANPTTNSSQFTLASLALNKECTTVHSHTTHTDNETCKNKFYIKTTQAYLFMAPIRKISRNMKLRSMSFRF